MDYKKMWFLLKRTVKEDYEIFCDESRLSSYSELHKGISSEAQDIIRRMDNLEVWESGEL